MKLVCFLLCLGAFTVSKSFAQSTLTDTGYIKPYQQKILLMGYVSNNAIGILSAGKTYMPNTTLNIGAGVALKNTIINAMFDYGVIPLRSSAYGKTKLTDFQVHNYRKNFVLDVFLQNYKGFYYSKPRSNEIEVYPGLSISQIGAEGSYILNGSRFSSKAAFEQSEMQLKSAGSLILGGGVYLYKLGIDSNMRITGGSPVHNFQAGFNLGYGYSWVVDDHWLLSGTAKIGVNSVNEPQTSGNRKLIFYPTAFARGASAYQKPAWAVAFLMLINNKSVYAYQHKFEVTSVNFQLSYVRHLNSIFRKKHSAKI